VSRRRALGLACALALGVRSVAASAADEGDYLRYVAFELPFGEAVLLRWQERQMPLKLFLPPPPDGLFEDPEPYVSAVRRGLLGWASVAGEDLPRFEFVEKVGDADIPVTWALEPHADWYIAHASLNVTPSQRRFDVAQFLITARWQDGRRASPEDLYAVVLHEMGHALGFAGHSPDPEDMMHGQYSGQQGLSDRDRATLKKLYGRPIGSRVTGAKGSRMH
jgi:hypothetical protein